MSQWKDASRVLPPYDAPLKIRWKGDPTEYDATLALMDGANAWMTEAPYNHPPDEWRLAEGASRGLFLAGLAKSFPFVGAGVVIGPIMLIFGGLGFTLGWLLLAFGLGMWIFTAWTHSVTETLTAKANSQGGAIAISTVFFLALTIPALYLVFLILRFVFAGGPMPAILRLVLR